jgi:hypothetical protein
MSASGADFLKTGSSDVVRSVTQRVPRQIRSEPMTAQGQTYSKLCAA